MNQEQLIQQIEYCEKELKKLTFQTLSISKYKEFLENELEKINEANKIFKHSSYETFSDVYKNNKDKFYEKLE